MSIWLKPHSKDIVLDKRIVSSYTMWRNDEIISVSLASLELRPDGNQTHLTYAEHGTRELLGTLARYIEAEQRA